MSGAFTAISAVAGQSTPAGASSSCSTHTGSSSFDAGKSTVSVSPGTNGSSTSGLPGGCSPLTSYVTDTVYGPTTATITVTVKDSSGNPMSGQAVELNPASSSSAVVNTVTGTTGADGKATFTMTDAVHETVTYTVSDITACTDQSRDGCVYGASYNGTADSSPLDDGEFFTAVKITFAAGYSIGYNLNGGAGTDPTDSTIYGSGSSVTLPDPAGLTPPAGCSSIAGWSNNANYPTVGALYTVPGTFTITGNTTLYAVWNCTSFSVTYYANGGSGTAPTDGNTYPDANPATIADGESLTPPTGCTFAGWSEDPTATSADPAYAPESQVTVSANIALYAVYTCTTYTVTYDANGGSGTVPTDPTDYASGDTVTVRGGSDLTYTGGCHFIGWDPSSTATTPTYPSTESSTFTISADVTLYAVYGECGWDVTYDNGAGSGSVVDPQSPYVDGTTVTVLGGTGLVPPTGQEFIGWSYIDGQTTPDITAGQTFVIHADTLLFAVYGVTLSFDAGTGSGTISAQTAIAPGSPITLPADQDGLTAPANQQFNGWNCGGTPYEAAAVITMDVDTTCTAQWAPIPVTLSFNPGTGSGSIEDQPYSAGNTVTLPADQDGLTAPANQQFNGWSCGGDPYPAGGTFTITADTTCTAQWAPIPVTLTVVTSGNGGASVGGTVFVTTGSGYSSTSHDQGSTVILHATPQFGFVAVWGGACAGTSGNQCSVLLSASKNVTIHFVVNVTLPVFFFAVNKWDIHLTHTYVVQLERDLQALSAAGIHHLTLTGYADLRSTLSHNLVLGQNRAGAVERYLNIVAKELGLSPFTFTKHDGGPTSKFGPSYFTNRRTVVTYTVVQ